MTTLVMLTGGLGNQLFQFKAGLYMSQDDILILDSSLGVPALNYDGKPEIFSFDLPSTQVHVSKKRWRWFISRLLGVQLRDAKAAKHRFVLMIFQQSARLVSPLVLSIYFRKWVTVINSQLLSFNHKSELISGNKFLLGYFQSYNLNNEVVVRVLKSLKLSERSELVNEYIKLAKEERPLIVHLRLGDYKNETNFGILSPEYYESAVLELMSTRSYGKVWIFSDEPLQAEKILPNSVTAEARWIPEIDDSAAKTLEVMRHGAGYVIGNSTFSWWAAYLSHTNSPVVFAPEPWFVNLPTPQDLIPPHWQLKPAFFMDNSKIARF
jgi:hypothetical protein